MTGQPQSGGLARTPTTGCSQPPRIWRSHAGLRACRAAESLRLVLWQGARAAVRVGPSRCRRSDGRLGGRSRDQSDRQRTARFARGWHRLADARAAMDAELVDRGSDRSCAAAHDPAPDQPVDFLPFDPRQEGRAEGRLHRQAPSRGTARSPDVTVRGAPLLASRLTRDAVPDRIVREIRPKETRCR